MWIDIFVRLLEKLGLEKEIVKAVKAHNEIHGLSGETKMAKTLFCADSIQKSA